MDTPFMIDAIQKARSLLKNGITPIIIIRTEEEMKLIRCVFAHNNVWSCSSGFSTDFVSIRLNNFVEIFVLQGNKDFQRLVNYVKDYSCFEIVVTYPLTNDMRLALLRKPVEEVILGYPSWWGESPRICAPWSPEEDNALRDEVHGRVKMQEIERRHGRNNGGICSRIRKLFGRDFFYNNVDQATFDFK